MESIPRSGYRTARLRADSDSMQETFIVAPLQRGPRRDERPSGARLGNQCGRRGLQRKRGKAADVGRCDTAGRPGGPKKKRTVAEGALATPHPLSLCETCGPTAPAAGTPLNRA